MSLKYDKDLIQYSKELRKNQTQQEIKLWYGFLAKYPIRFQQQKVIDHFIADFYCAKARLVVVLDGGGHYTKEQAEYDAKRSNVFKQYGLITLRFSNIEADRNYCHVCTAINKEVKLRQESLLQAASDQGRIGGSPLV